MIKPVTVITGGRMSSSFGDEEIDIPELQKTVIKDYLKQVLPNFDTDNELSVISKTTDHSINPLWYRPKTLNDLPDHFNPWANDTSVVLSHWPLTLTERLTLALENYFFVSPYNPKLPFVGQDIKVMSVKHGNNINVTMCIPFIVREVKSIEMYFELKDQIHQNILGHAREIIEDNYNINLTINSQDKNHHRPTPYITATGSCIEFGEEGCVGRGNRVDGLISILRPSSVEAPFGKNPVYHTGRVHSFYASEISKAIYSLYGISNTTIVKTTIGDELFNPSNITILALERNNEFVSNKELKDLINSIFNKRDHLKAIMNGYLIPKSW